MTGKFAQSFHRLQQWIPAFAGMTGKFAQSFHRLQQWIPAFAGMTDKSCTSRLFKFVRSHLRITRRVQLSLTICHSCESRNPKRP
jgi:hypothetical protein